MRLSELTPLPDFPKIASRMSEDAFERMVERMVDCADALLMTGKVTQAEYDAWNRKLDKWASLNA